MVPAVDNRFLQEARERWQTANSAEEKNRKEALEDLKMLALDQWPADVLAARSERGRERPTLTIDQIGQPYRQLLSNQQQADASIDIVPEGRGANVQTAQELRGLIRAIEYQSDAKTQYGITFASAIGGGWGWIRVRSDYETPESFDQRIIIEAIENPFTVYVDPAARQHDRSDMAYALITQDVPVDQYKREFPNSKLAEVADLDVIAAKGGAGVASLADFAGVGDSVVDWFPKGNIRIAEYYERRFETVDIVEGTDGVGYRADQVPEGVGLTGRKRTAQIPYVTWCKINAVEILEGETDDAGNVRQDEGRRIPGSTIPLRPCFGEVLNVDGKRIYRGLVRAARDPQRMYNYQNSALVEDLALAPKPPILGAEGQFEGHEEAWEQANTRAFPYLEYKPITLAGQPVSPPTRPPGPDPQKIQATVVAVNQAKTDIRSTTGWYDTTDANRRNAEQSGRAIQARKQSQDQAGLVFYENFRKMIVSLGKVLLEWVPVIYDREGRIVQILGGEDKPQWAMIGANGYTRTPDGAVQPANALTPPGSKIFTLNPHQLGIYGVRVTMGASYTTRREEAAQTLGGLIQAHPPMMGVFGDLWIKNLDIPDAEEIAERVKRTIPPQILGDEAAGQIPPQAQAQIQQMQQMIQAMQAKLQEQGAVIETKQIEAQGRMSELQLKSEMERQKLQADMAMEQLKQENQRSVAELKANVDLMAQHVKLLLAQQQIDAAQARTNIQAQAQQLAEITRLAGEGADAQSRSIGGPTMPAPMDDGSGSLT